MNEHRSIKTYLDLTTLSLNDQTKFRLNDVDKIKNCFDFEREAAIKKLSKLVASLEYMDKILIVLSAASGGVSIISHLSVIGISAGIISSIFILMFTLITGIIKKLLKETRKKRTNHSKIIMLAKSKLNSIENVMSQAFIDLEISHEEFKTIVGEKQKYDKMKENIRNKKDGDEFSENE